MSERISSFSRAFQRSPSRGPALIVHSGISETALRVDAENAAGPAAGLAAPVLSAADIAGSTAAPAVDACGISEAIVVLRVTRLSP